MDWHCYLDGKHFPPFLLLGASKWWEGRIYEVSLLPQIGPQSDAKIRTCAVNAKCSSAAKVHHSVLNIVN